MTEEPVRVLTRRVVLLAAAVLTVLSPVPAAAAPAEPVSGHDDNHFWTLRPA